MFEREKSHLSASYYLDRIICRIRYNLNKFVFRLLNEKLAFFGRVIIIDNVHDESQLLIESGYKSDYTIVRARLLLRLINETKRSRFSIT